MMEIAKSAGSIIFRIFFVSTSQNSLKIYSFLNSILLTLFVAILTFGTAYGENIDHIKPRNGSNLFNNYVWNGNSLRTVSGVYCRTTWTFDGHISKFLGGIRFYPDSSVYAVRSFPCSAWERESVNHQSMNQKMMDAKIFQNNSKVVTVYVKPLCYDRAVHADDGYKIVDL
jgi:hypothetical protein